MLHILKDIVVNILSIIIVGLLAICCLFLTLELNYIGLVLSMLVVGIYVTLLCFFYKKIFSKRLFISFEFITSAFWVGMFILVNHLLESGYWSNEIFGGLGEFFVTLFAIFISVITFVATSIALSIKNRKN